MGIVALQLVCSEQLREQLCCSCLAWPQCRCDPFRLPIRPCELRAPPVVMGGGDCSWAVGLSSSAVDGSDGRCGIAVGVFGAVL